jgi:hypothetical protein
MRRAPRKLRASSGSTERLTSRRLHAAGWSRIPAMVIRDL